MLLNSSAVSLKWRPPPLRSLNGVLRGYRVVLKDDATPPQITNMTIDVSPNLLLTTLTPATTYTVRVAAINGAGIGPYSASATLRLDPATRILDQHQHRQPIGADIHPGDFITETWFVALLISMVTVMVLLFGAMLLVRRRQLLSKKTMTPSRSNGGVLATPLALKQDAPLWLDKDPLPEYASTLPDYAKLSTQEYARINTEYNSLNINSHGAEYPGRSPQQPQEYSRPDRLDYNRVNPEKEYARKELNLSDAAKNYGPKDYNNLQVQDYASPNHGHQGACRSQLADYAEVESTMAGQIPEMKSPAPYATTTLVTGSRRHGNSLVSIMSI